MNDFIWRWLALPCIHWLAVTAAIIFALALAKLPEAYRKKRAARGVAMRVPVETKMAEVTFQVTRADGTVEPPRTCRTYRNPLMRWAWAVRKALTKNRNNRR